MPKRKAASHDVAQSTPSSVSLSVRWALSGEILSVVSISPEACEWEEKAWHSMYKIQKIDYVPHPIRTQNKIPGKFPFLWEEDSFSTFSSDWAVHSPVIGLSQASAEELISSLPLDAHESQHLQAVVWVYA